MIKRFRNVNLKSPILIEGLPGMGNVGKITVDFIIESLEATKIFEISSYSFPNCVFVNDQSLADLPKVEIYYKKVKGRDLVFVSGDMQPVDERGCYEFCDKLLDLFKKDIEVITLGGIGLTEMPKKPSLYCVGSDKKYLNEYKSEGLKTAEGVVGPVIGVTGLLVGLAKQRGLKGVILLVETLGIPNYLGIKEAREFLKLLNKKLNLNLDIKQLNKEVKIIEKEINDKISDFLAKEEKKSKGIRKESANYIG